MRQTPTPRESVLAGRVRWGLLGLAAALFVGHVVARLIYRTSHTLDPRLKGMLDLTDESGLGTWAATSIMLLIGVVCVVLARVRGHRGWYGPAALFVFLSADDAAMIHERIGEAAHQSFSSGSVYMWLIVVAPVFAIAGLIVFVFLWRRLGRDRVGRRDLIIGFGCMGVAILFEVLEGYLVVAGTTWRGIRLDRYCVPIEETLEIVGPVFLLTRIGALLESDARALAAASGD